MKETPLVPIALADIDTDAGCVQHLLLAEARTPSYAGYDPAQNKIVMAAMKSVVSNRLALNRPWLFCSRECLTLRDFICAPIQADPGAGCRDARQFKGFSMSGRRVVLDPIIAQRIQENLAIANNPADARRPTFLRHVQDAIDASASTENPYQHLQSIGGVEVLQGAYGWRTADTGAPGPNFPAIPEDFNPSGKMQGIQFFALKKAMQALTEDEFVAQHIQPAS